MYKGRVGSRERERVAQSWKESGPVTSFTAVLRCARGEQESKQAREKESESAGRTRARSRAIEFKYSIMRCVNEIEALCKCLHAKGCCKFKGLNIY